MVCIARVEFSNSQFSALAAHHHRLKSAADKKNLFKQVGGDVPNMF
jgi:hypothetical protein